MENEGDRGMETEMKSIDVIEMLKKHPIPDQEVPKDNVPAQARLFLIPKRLNPLYVAIRISERRRGNLDMCKPCLLNAWQLVEASLSH